MILEESLEEIIIRPRGDEQVLVKVVAVIDHHPLSLLQKVSDLEALKSHKNQKIYLTPQ